MVAWRGEKLNPKRFFLKKSLKWINVNQTQLVVQRNYALLDPVVLIIPLLEETLLSFLHFLFDFVDFKFASFTCSSENTSNRLQPNSFVWRKQRILSRMVVRVQCLSEAAFHQSKFSLVSEQMLSCS